MGKGALRHDDQDWRAFDGYAECRARAGGPDVAGGGGEAIGVIPRDLMDRGLGLTEATSLRVVETMHARKALMVDLSDAFVALPGGFGTMEEFFEALTWAQLGLHVKPCGLLNVKGYFDHLIRFVDHAVQEQFIDPVHRSLLLVDDSPESLLTRLSSWKSPAVDKAAWAAKWMREDC